MSIIIEVELLAGRYHAHVWGEAQFAMAGPEWPPSPWRLLRALASAWFDTNPGPQAERDDLLRKLGRCSPPEMWLPVTAFHEVRYSQPLQHKRALHHDYFAVPQGRRFYFVLHLDEPLLEAEERLLRSLLSRLRYFGRAESRATLSVRHDLIEAPSGFFKVVPINTAAASDVWTPRRVLCPSVDRDFKASDLWSLGQDDGSGTPVHLVDALLKAKKPLPAGARWVEYALPQASIVSELPAETRIWAANRTVDTKAIGFRLCRRVPIPLAELAAVARRFRDAAVSLFTVAGQSHSCTLTGLEADGSVMRGHRHLYYLPQPNDDALGIATLLVRVPDEAILTQGEIDSLLRVERIRLRRNDRYPITVVPEGIVQVKSRPSRVWHSLTPFLPPLHHRAGRAETHVEEQLTSCLKTRFGLTPNRISRTSGPRALGGHTQVRAHQYVGGSQRTGGGPLRMTRRIGHWFTIEFDTPVDIQAPVGADAHYGLGQFISPVDRSPGEVAPDETAGSR